MTSGDAERRGDGGCGVGGADGDVLAGGGAEHGVVHGEGLGRERGAGSVGFNAGNTVATFTPTSSLAASTTYTATVSGAQNASGTPMSGPFTLEFHHWRGVPVPVQHLAERDADGCGGRRRYQRGEPRRAVPGQQQREHHGVRFYKYSDNTGTHIGSLWCSAGTLLATGTFSDESASGWQELDFSSPVPITAGTTYVVLLPHQHRALRRDHATGWPRR